MARVCAILLGMKAFHTIALSEAHHVLAGTLPDALVPDAAAFDALWALHPEAFHEIVMHGRKVRTPRWQQAYGVDYAYTGNVNRALPVTPQMQPWLTWARAEIEPRLNGLLFNWYDGAVGHYIGKHRDSDVNRVEATPIVTISFGEARVFRVRPWRGQGFVDIPAVHGGVIMMPWATNRAFTHEVPASSRATGRRISLTLRAFHD
jgi:alkylated DNA repair dioxygenase AlkB